MKILGIDYGKRKIGVAVGDDGVKLVEPLSRVKNDQFSIINFQTIINDQLINKIVVGLTGGKIDNEIKVFGEKLKKQTGIEVEYFDETLTTQDAQKMLIESGRSRKSRKENEDAVAAAIMLQWYFDTDLN